MADNCKCIDCGGDQPGHSKDCEYMAELHGEPEAKVPDGLEIDVKVKVMNCDPRHHYDDPLAQRGFLAVKIVSNGKSYGDWITFKDVADEGAVRHMVSRALDIAVVQQVVDHAERHNTRRRRAKFGQADG